ncbi:galactokinase [Vagococcus xieshaowenii]|uniref:Galactokinase n=1 Tax=Vagococcus xieshaowenii TaxID=2562451 RepID=A0A4Z0D344_9ENTE|nr:galactokinase [Vagococcus xieshaowenii]QCA28126.1 galactokinase [Vagococcus xieshaowenii]TFZ40170.1 galactokinase [Vagococcus xieshaowenii]
MNTEQLTQQFETIFGTKNEGVYFSPGRINLIGEHTDYNGGHVFPAAITIGTYGLIKKREDQLLRFYSANFPELGIITVSLDDLNYKKEDNWTNYPKGMIHYMKEDGHQIPYGLDIFFYGNIPNGAGLSSSASIELLTGVIINNEFQLDIPQLELVKYGKKTENDFIGVNSGIMDQFAIGMGKKDQAMLLDTNTLKYELVPAAFGDNVIVIMNTNKRRELADSKYNERRSECEEALRRLQTDLPIHALGDLDEEAFEKSRHLINDDTLERRAKHAVTENQRTLKAKEALVRNDLETFGRLLNASHESLQFDYEVTGIELDTLVATAQKQPGVLGARMTGAGFGGCAIALVNKDMVEAFKEQVNSVYTQTTGYPADFYIASVDDGARQLN